MGCQMTFTVGWVNNYRLQWCSVVYDNVQFSEESKALDHVFSDEKRLLKITKTYMVWLKPNT